MGFRGYDTLASRGRAEYAAALVTNIDFPFLVDIPAASCTGRSTIDAHADGSSSIDGQRRGWQHEGDGANHHGRKHCHTLQIELEVRYFDPLVHCEYSFTLNSRTLREFPELLTSFVNFSSIGAFRITIVSFAGEMGMICGKSSRGHRR
jgi:hypothetical protein